MSPWEILIHLRLPFSLFLAPVALLGLVAAGDLDLQKTFWILLSLHVFLYPSSNAFNSYFDRDQGPIGGVKNPPAVDGKLLKASFVFLVLGLGTALLAGWGFFLAMVVYSLCSMLYSWDKTRWKSKPYAGLLLVVLGQGGLTALAVALSAGRAAPSLPILLWGTGASALLLWGIYPLTQVYQHDEDKRRGDISYSLQLGIKGTFLSSGAAFLLAGIGLAGFLFLRFPGEFFVASALCFGLMLPALIYFALWATAVWKDPGGADFTHTMRMNLLASLGLNTALIILLFIPGK